MSSTVVLSAYGITFEIRGSRSLVAPLVAAIHERAWLQPGGHEADVVYDVSEVGGLVHLARSDESGRTGIGRTLEPLAAAHVVVDDMHLQMSHRSESLLFVHAGVVEWRGVGIAVPGRSMTGKSTLVAAAVRAGAGYLSDEFAILDAGAAVHPYPRPLSLRDAGGA
ncbi:MAG: hypothetical protein ACE5GB_04920, partial [Acidimicrobiales bacterium]